jgi:uncharacterized protein (TIGR04255 family)
MASPDAHIVDFAEPPVAEVALSVQLGGPVLDATRALGDFWPRIREQYPKLQQSPMLPPLESSFEVPTPGRMIFNIAGPESARYLFVSDRENELVQVQENRLGYNWRKTSASETYPRYAHVREHFASALDGLLEVIGDDVPLPWCEISYVNPVALGGPGEPRPDLSRIIRRVADVQLSALPATPINTALVERFRVEREDGSPYAWFFVEIEPTVTAEQTLAYGITLLMRGQPTQPGKAGVLAFFDDGRSRIVRTFHDITTPEMHDRWGLR